MAGAALLVLGISTAVFGAFDYDVGGLPGMFLNYGGTPRSLAMGKAFTGLANDIEAGYFNPAGLVQLNAQNVKLAHSTLYGDVRLEYLAYGLPTRSYGTFGLTLVSDWCSGIESRDAENFKRADWGFFENAVLFSYAYGPLRWLGLGANLKVVTKNMNYYSGVGAGIDAGAMILAPRPLQFGIVVQNLLAPQMAPVHWRETYPLTFRLGAAARFYKDRVSVAADLVKVNLDTLTAFKPHAGIEFELVPGIIATRLGFDMNEVSAGLGLKQLWGNFGLGVDYAILLHHISSYTMPPTHKLGLSIEFAGYRTWIQASPSMFSPTPDDKRNVLWMDVKTLSRRAIKRWQILIKNSLGEVVKTFGSWEMPPLRIAWDGLDEAGRLVSDGRYYYEIVLVDERNETLDHDGFLTMIRTRGPQGKIEIEKKE
jgi:hypothetical protein